MIMQGNIGLPGGHADLVDVTLRQLRSALDGSAALPLVFSCEGSELRAGYHVTEVKAARFDGLDCGANPESWTEVMIQLWDVGEGPAHMPADRFLGIIGKVADRVALDQDARLTFEVSDGSRPLQLYRAALPRVDDGAVRVGLTPRPASCKPRDRWAEAQASSCAAPAGAKPCCG